MHWNKSFELYTKLLIQVGNLLWKWSCSSEDSINKTAEAEKPDREGYLQRLNHGQAEERWRTINKLRRSAHCYTTVLIRTHWWLQLERLGWVEPVSTPVLLRGGETCSLRWLRPVAEDPRSVAGGSDRGNRGKIRAPYCFPGGSTRWRRRVGEWLRSPRSKAAVVSGNRSPADIQEMRANTTASVLINIKINSIK